MMIQSMDMKKQLIQYTFHIYVLCYHQLLLHLLQWIASPGIQTAKQILKKHFMFFSLYSKYFIIIFICCGSFSLYSKYFILYSQIIFEQFNMIINIKKEVKFNYGVNVV